MSFVYGRGQHAEIDDPRAAAVDKDKAAKIPIPSDKDAFPFLRNSQQLRVGRSRKSQRCRCDDIMTQAFQEDHGSAVHILVSKKLHGSAATCKSSTATTSMAN